MIEAMPARWLSKISVSTANRIGPIKAMDLPVRAYRPNISACSSGGESRAISEREARNEEIDQSFVGIDSADILEAEVKEGIASVTVRFASQLISATRDAAGEVIDGDPHRIKEVTDIWTFSRDVSTPRAASNPNWKLVATLANA